MAGGAPIGNQNAVKNRPWAAAIKRALAKRSKSDQLEALDELAEKFLSACDAQDLAALKELGDRLDGKPAQVIAGDPENPLGFEMIERKIVDPKG